MSKRKMTRREFDALVPGAVAGALLDPFDLAAAAGLRVEKDGTDIRFVSGSTMVARIPAVAQGDGKHTADQVRFGAVGTKKTVRTFQSGPWEVTEQIQLQKDGLYEWRRSWKNRTSEPVQADLCMEIESGYSPEFTLVPGISYNGNPEYGRRAPKGLSNGGKPWIFSAFRCNIPAGNYSEGGGWSIFVFTSTEHKSLHCAFSLEERNNRLAHRLLWPERDNLPAGRPPSASGQGDAPPPLGARAAAPPIHEKLSVAPGEGFAVTAYLVLAPALEKRRAFSAGMDHAWRLNRRDVRPAFPPKRLWKLGIQFGRESLWYDNDDPAVKFTGFCFGMSAEKFDAVPGPEGFKKFAVFPFGSFDIGWCNQNAAWGVVMLQDYIWNKNKDSLDKGERSLDFWAENGRLPNGLFLTEWAIKLGLESWGSHNVTYLGRPAKPREYFLDCVNLGFGGYNYLVASELAEKIGKPKPLWRTFATDMCDFFVDHILPDGTFGKAWSLQGECLQPGFTTGAFILMPMLKAYKITRQPKYLETSKRAFRAYLERDLDHFVCTSGAIDADTIDREAGVPMLFAAVDLYEITGSKEYLKAIELAAYYLASWQWHYALPMHPDSPLLKINYEWFGGTGITVMSQSQDPWGALWAWAWLRLAKMTGNDIWRDRAVQVWNQSSHGISDGTMVVHGVKHPVGSQPEVYSCRLITADGRRFYGDIRDWLVAWPSPHRFMTLMNWPNWKDFEV